MRPIPLFLTIIFLLGAGLTALAGDLDRAMLCLILANQFRGEGGKP